MTIILPFPYQRDCLERLEETRCQDIARALVVMATGLGKTVVAALDAKEVIEMKSWRVLYLAHQNEILEQARATFEEVLGDKATYGYFNGTTKTKQRVTCLFASFQTMQNWRESFDADEFDYVIVDESHHSHAETYLPTIKYFKPKFLLAITATPDRKDLRDIRHLYGKEVFTITLEEALAKGYLTTVEYLLLIDEVQAQQAIETSTGNFSIKELNRRLFIPMRDEKIVETILEKSKGIVNPRTVVFCSSIRHCDNIAKLLPNAAAIHSKVPGPKQRELLKAFRSGELATIVTVDQFNEGIDIPAANVIVFLRSTSSRTVFIQQLGRGLRRAEGKSSVLVLDFVGNCERMEKVYQLTQKVKEYEEREAGAVTDGESGEGLIINHGGNFYFTEIVQDVLSIIGEVRTGYTKRSLLEYLQVSAVTLRRSPSVDDIRRERKAGRGPSVPTFVRAFGTWNAALDAAGLPVTRGRGKDQLLHQLKELADELGRTPTIADITKASAEKRSPSADSYKVAFGSWVRALDAAGLVPAKRLDNDQDKIVAQLQALAKKLGRIPTRRDVDREAKEFRSIPNSGTLRNKFGSFSGALEAAELKPENRVGEVAVIIEQLQALGVKLGRTPKKTDIGEASKAGECCSPTFLAKRFGSLTAALEAAGFVPTSKQKRK